MIAITGATGQLGGLIIENLLQSGTSPSEIIAVARTPQKANDLANKGVKVRHGDYADTASLVTACDGVQVLMFISNTDFASREEQHDNVVAAAKEAGIPHVVYTSVVDFGQPNPLVEGHHRTEQVIKDSGAAWTFLRNNFYMEPYVVEVEIAMKTGTYRTPTAGDVGAAIVSRADIARAAAAVLSTDGHQGVTYNLTGPSQVTPQTFAAVASEISGKEVTHQSITWDELTADYAGRGMPQDMIDLAIWLEQIIAAGGLSMVSDDISRLTGQPATSFSDFVKSHLGS